MSVFQRPGWQRAVPLLLTLLLAGVWSGVTTAQDPAVMDGDPMNGRDIFVSKGCLKCHSVWGMGGKLGPDLTKVGMGRSFLQIAGSLWSHSPRMIELMEERHLPLPTMTPEEIRDLIAYLYYLNYFNEPGDQDRGQQLFSEKGCIYCHSVNQIGGKSGPRLDSYQQYGAPLFVAQAMWNHGPRMTSDMARRGVKVPKFQNNEMADLLAFIRGRAAAGIQNQKLATPGNPTPGKQVFINKGCATCHAIRGRGGVMAPDLGKDEFSRSVTGIAGAMWNHGPAMWAKMDQMGLQKPRFSQSEMADLIAYLYFVGCTDPPGNAKVGEKVFSQKGCSECHAVAGGEEKSGPDLATSPALSSSIKLIAAMWNHAPAMEKMVQEKGLSWPKFEGDELRDLVEYIRSFQGRTARNKSSR